MRFKAFYLDESSKRFTPIDLYPPELAKEISKNCKKYIKDTKKHWFQRAMSLDLGPTTPGGYRETRTDRKPLGTHKPVFKLLNKWLVKNGHADRSKSVMCAREADEIFGDPYYVFVAGNYKYTWVKTDDFNYDADNSSWYQGIADEYFSPPGTDVYGPDFLRLEKHKIFQEYKDLGAPMDSETSDKIDREYNEKVRKWLDEEFPKQFVTNKGMSTAWKENYEIWFECKGYYFIRENIGLWDEMQRMIK